jgi:aerobic-type carbon monoxide dehydrogenase small subunit (CoxS/CutS family)
MSTVTIDTFVNGQRVTRQVAPRMTLAEFLRDDLGLTGTKVSCEMQVCGACTVLIDDMPVSACTYLAADADSRRITTVEGLAHSDELHPIQAAFVENFAIQCGFCTPGFVMMTAALLRENPAPTAEEVAEYMDGNICRCTGYKPILSAVLDAAERLRGTE